MRRSLWVACCVGLVGCQTEATFVNNGLVSFALTEDTPPVAETDESALYIVEARIELPVRGPNEAELQSRREGAADYENLPFDRLPWVDRDDLGIEIDYTVANMDDETHDLVTVTLNGIDEFYEYMPGFTIDEDDILVDYAQWERTHKLGPFERATFTIREAEVDEVAVDLATVVNGAPNSNQIVYFDNQSGSDERSQPYIPEVIPGLIGARIGIRTTEQSNIVVEASVRVRQERRRLIDGDEAPLEVTPEIFRPVVPVEE